MSVDKLTMDGRVVERFLQVLVPDVGFEIRSTMPGRDAPQAVVYAAGKQAAAVAELQRLDKQGMSYSWVSLNGTTLQPGKHPRCNSTDTVPARRWLFVDLDPVREAKLPSTDAELAAARELAQQVRAALAADGWPDPVQAMSGNGHHLLYRIDLPVDDGGLVQRVLAGLAHRFSTDQVRLDAVNHDAARNIKVAGTVSRKGPHTADRPWRVSQLLHVPDKLVPVSREMLERAAVTELPRQQLELRPLPVSTRAPVAGGLPYPTGVTGQDRAPRLREYLESRGVQVQGVRRKGTDLTLLYLARCPVTGVEANGPNSTDLCVLVPDSGPLAYRNEHNRGAGTTWHHVRAVIDPRTTKHPTAPDTWVPSEAPAGAAAPLEANHVQAELELVVLSGLVQFVPDDPEQAVALEGARRLLHPDCRWQQLELLGRVQETLAGLADGAATAALLQANGIDAGTAELLMHPVRPQQVQAAVAELEQHDAALQAERAVAQLRDTLTQEDVPAAERLRQVHELAQQAVSTQTTADVQMGAATWRAMFEATLARHDGRELQGLGTGLPWWDGGCDGLRGLMLLAAAPGAGKSNLALFLQLHVLRTEQRACCVFVSGELDRHTVYRRLLALTAELPVGFVGKGTAASLAKCKADEARGEQDTLQRAHQWLREGQAELEQLADRWCIHDVRSVTGGTLTVDQLQLVVQTAQRHSGCREVFVVLDSLQAIGGRLKLEQRASSETERENHVMAAVAALQARLDQPVLCISEQNKAGMDGNSMTSVRGSGRNIYQPDYVGLLYQRPEPDKADEKAHDKWLTARLQAEIEQRSDVVLEVVKARDGGRKGKTFMQHFYREGWFEQTLERDAMDMGPIRQAMTENDR